MREALGLFLRQHLSAESYFTLRYALPRNLRGVFDQAYPRVRCYSPSDRSSFAATLEAVNVRHTTKLCRIMAKYGSDKSGDHTYTVVYGSLLGARRERVKRVFELGLGTTDASIPANMGTHGKPGASLRGWREYFPHAEVFGADIDLKVLFEEDRIRTYQCDQTDLDSITRMWSATALQEPFDLIIDDGLHTFEANQLLLEASINRLNDGGLYVVEDVSHRALTRWAELLSHSGSAHDGYCFCTVELPGTPSHPQDNNLVIVRRGVPAA
jgi:SAM-dependent methyltransferase